MILESFALKKGVRIYVSRYEFFIMKLLKLLIIIDL